MPNVPETLFQIKENQYIRSAKNMKKFILIFTILLLMSTSLAAQTPNDEIEKLKQINQEVVAKYKEGRFDAALKSAEQALELTANIFGTEHTETATSYINLGEIYRAQKKYRQAAENLHKALLIYQRQPSPNFGKIAAAANSLGVALALDGKKEEAESMIEQSVRAAEKAYGQESKEILSFLKTQTDYYIVTKQFDKTDDFYTRRYKIALKIFGRDSEELDQIEEERYCLVSKTSDSKELIERQKRFYEAVSNSSVLKSGIVNGKAISLPRPAYPMAARAERAGGSFPVKVLIDESGNVVSARPICGGHPVLQQASQEAALKARVKPTELDGKPIKVSGIIVYHYVR